MKTLVILPMNVETHPDGGVMICRVRLEGYGEYRRARWLILAEHMDWYEELRWLFNKLGAEDMQLQRNYLIPSDWISDLDYTMTTVLLTEKPT